MTKPIGERIKNRRESLGIDQRTAAHRSGLNLGEWSRIEAGGDEATLGQLIVVCCALDLTLESLTDRSPVRERLQVAVKASRKPADDAERRALNEVLDRLAFTMEVDAHLRYIGVGLHHAPASGSDRSQGRLEVK